MANTAHFTVRIDKALKMEAQKKANKELGIGLGTLTKLFFKYFVSEKETPKIVFYINNEDFDKKLNQTLKSKKVKRALQELANNT